ncbi:low-density lipoprotein receptor-related protein 4-like isoform X2 [Lytechinus pictus]|uniref:low-density lipoprotein receptor-related protein 4-like isoform X2 n=1 Tax=Lytechinus pictus TaxID=7653 RepID=UPI0030B9E9B6
MEIHESARSVLLLACVMVSLSLTAGMSDSEVKTRPRRDLSSSPSNSSTEMTLPQYISCQSITGPGGTTIRLQPKLSPTPPGNMPAMYNVDRHIICRLPDCYEDPCWNLVNGACEETIDGQRCVCLPGYIGINCETDINECESNPCQNGGTCMDLVNEYRCQCPTGYIGSRCELESSICFLLKWNSIFAGSLEPSKSLLDTTFTELPINGMGNPHSIAYDHEDRMVYWTDRDNETISRATINGTISQEILVNLTGLGDGELTLEFQDRKIYWVRNMRNQRIERANFDGSDHELLTTDVNQPRGIAVDGVNRKLFWMEQWGVRSSDLNGKNRVNIAMSETSSASCVFYYQGEFGDSQVIFTDLKKVKSVKPDGTNQTVLFNYAASTAVRHVTVYNATVYFITNYYFHDPLGLGEVPLSNLSAVRVIETFKESPKDSSGSILNEPTKNIRDIYVYNIT